LTRIPKKPLEPTVWEEVNVGVVRLLLDDIQDILDHLKSLGADATLFAGTSLATSSDDLKDATRSELRAVTIKAYSGDFVLQLSRQRTRARWRRTSPLAKSAIDDCISLLRPRRLNGIVAFLTLWATLAAVFCGVIGVGVVVATLIREARGETADWGNVAITILAMLGVTGMLAALNYLEPGNRYSGARIKPYFRREQREVTLSRRTAVVGALIGAIASAGLGATITWWLGQSGG